MLTHYLTSAIRNLSKHKTYTLINLVGLSVGLTWRLGKNRRPKPAAAGGTE